VNGPEYVTVPAFAKTAVIDSKVIRGLSPWLGSTKCQMTDWPVGQMTVKSCVDWLPGIVVESAAEATPVPISVPRPAIQHATPRTTNPRVMTRGRRTSWFQRTGGRPFIIGSPTSTAVRLSRAPTGTVGSDVNTPSMAVTALHRQSSGMREICDRKVSDGRHDRPFPRPREWSRSTADDRGAGSESRPRLVDQKPPMRSGLPRRIAGTISRRIRRPHTKIRAPDRTSAPLSQSGR
jgi:hypothetical protein